VEPENDRRLRAVQDVARGLQADREDMGESVGELRETLTELHREPRAPLELTEEELNYLIEIIPEPDLRTESDHREAWTLINKAVQALAVETRPGGKFWTGGEAA